MDKYGNFEALKAEQLEARDFRVQIVSREEAKVAVIAPHGGKIEPGTSELAIALAGEELSFAVFEGLKPRHNRDLHITSTNFDEPRFVELVASTNTALAVHGENSRADVVFIGGLNKSLRVCIAEALSKAGFNVQRHGNPNLQGKSLFNICNRGIDGSGVQLEISRGLRSNFFQSLNTAGRERPTDEFDKFVKAVRLGMYRAGYL